VARNRKTLKHLLRIKLRLSVPQPVTLLTDLSRLTVSFLNVNTTLRIICTMNGGRPICTRAVCKVRGLTLLLRVGTSWRCGDSIFLQVPLMERDALLTTLHPLVKNMLQTVDHFEISCLGAPLSWLEKPRNRTGRDLN
jgi:hypothetical protein